MKKQPHHFRDLSPEQQEENLSNFLIDSWSPSKVSAFARNEKAFEMEAIFRYRHKTSASAAAGSAYHYALEYYFTKRKEGITVDVVDLQTLAFNYIEELGADKWKIQKTTRTVQECRDKSVKISVKLLDNFLSDISVYESEIKEILHVELRLNEFLTINGVDIPIPCHMVMDLVFLSNDDKIIIVDHKSKASFSDEHALKFSMGIQTVTYACGFEAHTGVKVDEVWIVENKHSANRDKTIPQLSCFKTVLDKDTIRLYQALLYEPLKRMIEAISNPNYVYLINEHDNFVDKAELYEFWCKTMISEVEDFDIPESKQELISKRLKKIVGVIITQVFISI